MKLLLLTAFIAAVASNPLTEGQQWPWQVGKEYLYNVDSYTWSKFEQSNSNGNAFKAQFIIRVLAPGNLVAKLENPMYAQVQDKMDINAVPSDIKYQPLQKLEHPFEIIVDGGRVLSLKVPSSLSVSYENLLKGLISALQVDLSTFGHVNSFPNSYDKETFQGLFKKTEGDVTGDCETLYSVSPISAEWRRELPEFESEEDPIEVIKSKNYGSCKERVAYHFGVPEGALWKGIAYENDEKQFIKHSSESRMLVGKLGTIYKSEVMSSVFVNPLLFGKQKAEVYSYVGFHLASVQPETNTEWHKSEESRVIDSLLFTLSETSFTNVGEQNIPNAQKLLQEMTPLLQKPNNLPKNEFLTKFNTLVRFITSMDTEQLTQMTNSIEVAKYSKNVVKNNMWIIYRDAVAQTGTIAAFKEIKAWILTKKIEGSEAAEVISSMASILRYPTKEVINEFFTLATSPVVQEQKFLNTSALLAATKFIRFSKDNLFTVEKVIPHLAEELKLAIEKSDDTKAQVYVRVLGNLAHPDILKVFAPYLEGHIKVTKYLRIQMVISLKTLANMKDEYVRAVLYSILKNTAEPYEVRVAAALNIFLIYPTAEMMQIMAFMTNEDPSTQVRAVLANSITFAAGLKDPRFVELSKTAKAVMSSISKEKFGYRYSTDSMIDDYTSNDEIAHFREVSFIGSQNNILPVYQRGALRFRSTGWTEENWFTLSVSDMQHLMDYVTGMYLNKPKKSNEADFKFSAKKIAEILNIKREPRCHLETAFFLDNWNQQTLITLNEDDFNSLIMDSTKHMDNLLVNFDSSYTKMLTQKQVFVTFPLAMGMPFMFEYSEPTAIIIQGQNKLEMGETKTTAGSFKLTFTYARNLDGSVGFLDTIGDVYARAGVVNKLQFNIPAWLNIKSKSKEIQLKFELPEEDVNLIHLSVWPYTAMQKTHSMVPISEDPATKLIDRPVKVFSTDFKFGHLAGVVFNLRGYSYSSDYKDPSNLFDADLLTNIRNMLYQKDVALTNINLKYLAKESPNKAVTYTLFYDTLYNQKQSGELGPASLMNDVTPNSVARREELVKKVASGIESAKVQLVDISAVFDGKQKVEYVFTAATANSFVDNKYQAAVFFHGYEQINAVFKMIKPKIAPMNFEEALKNKIKVVYEADLKYGNSENIQLQGFSERTEKYTEMLLNDPLAKQCQKETSKHNFYQNDCYKMIMKAHAPDYFKGTVTYKDLTPAAFNTTYQTYEFFKQMYSLEHEEDVLKTIDDGKLDIEIQAYYYDNYINYEFTTNHGLLRLNNVEGMDYYPYAMAVYAPTTSWERSRNWFTGYQNLPYCAVDDNKVWTFSGRSYDYSLTGSWHVVMVDECNDFGTWTDLVILARRPSEKQEEVYVSYKTEDGKFLELEIKPTTVEVKTNAKKITEGALTMYWDDVTQTPLLEYYTLADGVLVFNIRNGALRLVYDSQRLIIFTDDHRSTTRGLCGQSTTQTRDDYMTPWGLVDLPEYYGASFALDGDLSDPKTIELKKKAKLNAYQPINKFTSIFRSDAQWNMAENERSKGL